MVIKVRIIIRGRGCSGAFGGRGSSSDVSAPSPPTKELRYVVSPASITPCGRLGLFCLQLPRQPRHNRFFPVREVTLNDVLPCFRYQ